jgi:polyisoprenoid-binding protein YceI
MIRLILVSLSTLIGTAALAVPENYVIDPAHTYPSFEADHFGGMSIWRGKFTTTSGKIVLDRAAKSGTIEVAVDVASIQFGNPKLDEHAKSDQIFDAAKFPTATFKGSFTKFDGDVPKEAQGTFTLHGVSKPLTLQILQFKCQQNPMSKKYFCGADAAATLNRSDFGVTYGAAYGFKQEVKLQIQVEAFRSE